LAHWIEIEFTVLAESTIMGCSFFAPFVMIQHVVEPWTWTPARAAAQGDGLAGDVSIVLSQDTESVNDRAICTGSSGGERFLLIKGSVESPYKFRTIGPYGS